MAKRWPPMIGIVGFDGGYKPAVALALPPDELGSDEGEEEGGGHPGDQTGACCNTDGSCDDGITEDDCASSGGTYQGDGSTCADTTCPTGPTGACCIDNFCSILTSDDCSSSGGNYLGDGSTCDGVDCTEGACCAADGSCSITTESGCIGYFQGSGTTCVPNPCEAVPCCGAPFTGFLGGGPYFTKIVRHTLTDVGGEICTASTDQSTVTDWSTCSEVVTCFGSCQYHSDSTDQDCDWISDGFGGCVFSCTCNSCVGCFPFTAPVVISDTETRQTCDHDDGTSTSHQVITVILSNPCNP